MKMNTAVTLSKEVIPTFFMTEINKMCDLLIKPKRILRTLIDNQIQMKQLQNYISAYKKKKYGSTSISLGELEQWCIDNNNVLNSEDRTFIVNYKIVYSDDSDKEQENDMSKTIQNFNVLFQQKDSYVFGMAIYSNEKMQILSFYLKVCLMVWHKSIRESLNLKY